MKPTATQIEAVQLVVALEHTVALRTLIGTDAPLELELGCGKGEFVTEAARRRPDTFFVAVEIAPKYARKTATRLALAGLPNARVVWMNSLWFLERAVAPASVRGIHVYFPDPWPKRRHRRRRLFSPAFAAAAARALRPGGSLYFRTDDAHLFRQAVEVIGRAGGLAAQAPLFDNPDHPPTGYERKWLAEGRTIVRARWVRRGR